MSRSLSSVGEPALIERLRSHLAPYPDHVVIGIGDDAAVIDPERNRVSVVTTDCLVEGVHFKREWTGARDIGHKALAVNLSDLASMGASPRASLLSLVLPLDLTLDEFDALIEGYAALANASGAVLVGGNLARSPGPLVVDVTALGSAHRRRLLRRDMARPGHELFVTGTIGAAATGLAMRMAGTPLEAADEQGRECVRRYEAPEARVRCGAIVARSGAASGAMDMSDGLASVAHAMAEASGVGVTIEAASLPIHPGAAAWAANRGLDAARFSVTGGEDYELAFSVPPRLRRRFLAAMARVKDLPVTCVGRFHKEPGVWLSRDGATEPLGEGFGHFGSLPRP